MMVPELQVFASDVINLCVCVFLKVLTLAQILISLCLLIYVTSWSLCPLPLSVFFFFLSADGIVSFLKKQAGPASVELKADADLQKFITDQDASVVGELLFEFHESLCLQPVSVSSAITQISMGCYKPQLLNRSSDIIAI